MAHDTTLHTKLDASTNEQLSRLAAFEGGFISIGKLAESLGMNVLEMRRGFPNTASIRAPQCRPTIIGMPDRLPDRFFDTVTLSNFALSGAFDLLVDRYKRSMRVTEQVRAELAAGRIRVFSELEEVERALATGSIVPAEPMTSPESELFAELLRTLGSGEASCVALARHRGGIVATDDRAARSCSAERGIPVTGSIGILRALCIG